MEQVQISIHKLREKMKCIFLYFFPAPSVAWESTAPATTRSLFKIQILIEITVQ